MSQNSYDPSLFDLSLDNRTQSPLSDKQSQPFMLGTDAEIVISSNGEGIYPHQVSCPQERGGTRPWAANEYDWHGDGFAFEVCVSPDTCIERLLRKLAFAFGFLMDNVKFDNYSMPTLYTIPASVVAEAPENVRALGCMPSFNVYNDPGRPDVLRDDERTTGCHLHISHPDLDFSIVGSCVKWADVLVGGVWSFISPEDSCAEHRRRMCYGRAGEHRKNFYDNPLDNVRPVKKDYICSAGPGCFRCNNDYNEAVRKYESRKSEWIGYEYRVLPGAALSHPIYFSLMATLFRKATALGMHYGDPPEVWVASARHAINKADHEAAAALMGALPWEEETKEIIRWAGQVGSFVSPSTWLKDDGRYSGYLTHFAVSKVLRKTKLAVSV